MRTLQAGPKVKNQKKHIYLYWPKWYIWIISYFKKKYFSFLKFFALNFTKIIPATNITEHNGQVELETAKKSAEWTEKVGPCAKKFFEKIVTDCKKDMNKCTLVDETKEHCSEACDAPGRRNGLKVILCFYSPTLSGGIREFFWTIEKNVRKFISREQHNRIFIRGVYCVYLKVLCRIVYANEN